MNVRVFCAEIFYASKVEELSAKRHRLYGQDASTKKNMVKNSKIDWGTGIYS